MPLTVTLTPGKQFSASEALDIDKLNLLGQPTLSVTGSLTDLTGVSISAPTSGQVLTFDGTNWTSSDIPGLIGFITGDLKASLVSRAPSGWLLCDGAEYDPTDANYTALYQIIGDTFNTPTTTDGYFCVPDFRCARMVGAGGAGVQYFDFTADDVNITTDTISLPGEIQSTSVLTLVSSSLPDPLSTRAYYAIAVTYDPTTHHTTVRFATSLDNAVNGVYEDLTTTGSGYFYHTRDSRDLGSMHGFDKHVLTLTEMTKHTHGTTTGFNYCLHGGTWSDLPAGDTFPIANTIAATTANTGSNAVHSRVTAEIAVNILIKT